MYSSSSAIQTIFAYSYIDSAVLAADAMGGAQTRKRYFLIASKIDPKEIDTPLRTVADGLRHSARTLDWAIGDLLSSPKDPVRTGVMDTVPAMSELIVRKELHHRGLRYVIGDRRPPGSPNLSFPRHRAVVFVHGCFWQPSPSAAQVSGAPRARHVAQSGRRCVQRSGALEEPAGRGTAAELNAPPT